MQSFMFPVSLSRCGPAGYLAIIGMMRSGFPDIQWTLEEIVAEDDKIAARFTMRGTHGVLSPACRQQESQSRYRQ
jgi:predicted ester cyclase